MKRACLNLGIAAAVLMIAMIAGRSRTLATAAVENKASGEIAVGIENFAFSPGTITVPAGSTVRWINQDDSPHNIAAEDKSFKSKTLDTGDNFSYTFAKPGAYKYYCSLHPRMTGTILVK
jgi:plastocyanin